jgi:hypothetical protein
MVQTVTSHDYPVGGVFEAHSVLTKRLITMGRVVQCSKGFLPQVKSHNHWVNVSSSLPSLEAAREFLFQRHYKEAQERRGWSEEQLQQEVLKVQEKNLQMWSSRLQKRMELKRQLEANIQTVKTQASEIRSNPRYQSLTARQLGALVRPLSESVFFWGVEQTKTGIFRSLDQLIQYCDSPDLQQERLNKLAGLD